MTYAKEPPSDLKADVTIAVARKLAKFYGASLDELFGG